MLVREDLVDRRSQIEMRCLRTENSNKRAQRINGLNRKGQESQSETGAIETEEDV